LPDSPSQERKKKKGKKKKGKYLTKGHLQTEDSRTLLSILSSIHDLGREGEGGERGR